MSAIVVNTTDTFDQWRLKTNQLAVDVDDAIRNTVEDLTPQLGGDLDLNTKDITGTGDINITGDIQASGNLTGGGDLTGGGITITTAGDITSSAFNVVASSGNMSGTNWSYDGATSSITITGNYTGTTFSGDLNGTVNTATTGTTQAASDNSTKIATTEYVDTGIGNITLTIPALADTTITNPAHQHLLMFDTGTSKWTNSSILAAGVPNQSFTVAMAVALGY
jgi:hypothetical protein